jgi:hypothetical protein
MSGVKNIAMHIAALVKELPMEVSLEHGGADYLEQKITDLIFPLECDDDEPIPESPPGAPKPRGRPKGSKNKVSKDVPVSTEEAAPKKKRGRPKGSPNKPKDVPVSTEEAAPKKKRGRPVGSKNKVTKDVPVSTEEAAPKKKRGRPVGSKNKVTKDVPVSEGKVRKPTQCGLCGETGHNSRTCQNCT